MCENIYLFFHEHEWQEATCTTPITCIKCDETQGEPLGHTWVDATCSSPQTCSVCGETSGHSLKHDWLDATCTEPKTCSLCGETKGDPLGHYVFSFRSYVSVEPTCESPGISETKCGRCDEVIETKSIPAKGHKKGKEVVIDPGSPTTPTVVAYYCTVCDAEIERLEREYVAPEVASEGTSGNTHESSNRNNFNTYDNPEQQQTTATYVLNTSTRKFHHPWCRDVARIAPRNYSTTNASREDVIARGYQSCGHCYP